MEPGWDSPWGRGRPGWHIECSAMSAAHLGEVFDIHGGGIDLVFPHHENEVAQSRCAHGTETMARYWMHNGFLQVEGEKMAKSAGNFFTIRELLDQWPGEVLRLAMLMTHYRQPLNWTREGLEQAAVTLSSFRQWSSIASSDQGRVSPSVVAAMCDDLNTPLMLSELHRLADGARKVDFDKACDLRATCDFLGLNIDAVDLQEISERQRGGVDRAKISSLMNARTEARKRKDFAEADRIRDELAEMGIRLKDNPDGTTTWEVAR